MTALHSLCWAQLRHWVNLEGLISTIGNIDKGRLFLQVSWDSWVLCKLNVIFLLQFLNKEQTSQLLWPWSLHIELKIFVSLHGRRSCYWKQYHLSLALWHYYFEFWDRGYPRILDLVPQCCADTGRCRTSLRTFPNHDQEDHTPAPEASPDARCLK